MLIDPPCARRPAVDLLQQDDVGVFRADVLGDGVERLEDGRARHTHSAAAIVEEVVLRGAEELCGMARPAFYQSHECAQRVHKVLQRRCTHELGSHSTQTQSSKARGRELAAAPARSSRAASAACQRRRPARRPTPLRSATDRRCGGDDRVSGCNKQTRGHVGSYVI
eukprot:896396-Pleurochrysis_carterae.AAC.1